MSATQFTAPSGKVVVINTAPWKDAKFLKMALEKEIGASAGSIAANTGDVQSILATIMRADSSELVDRAIWPCLARCTRGDEKIIETTFDDPDARQDYYEILSKCVEVNLRPLLDSLLSMLTAAGVLKKRDAGQK